MNHAAFIPPFTPHSSFALTSHYETIALLTTVFPSNISAQNDNTTRVLNTPRARQLHTSLTSAHCQLTGSLELARIRKKPRSVLTSLESFRRNGRPKATDCQTKHRRGTPRPQEKRNAPLHRRKDFAKDDRNSKGLSAKERSCARLVHPTQK